MMKLRKTIIGSCAVLGIALLCSCGNNGKSGSGVLSTEVITEETTTEATTTEATTTEATTEVTTEETTTEVTTTEVTTTEASNIITDNGSPMSYKEAVNAYENEGERYFKKYWIQHEDRLYSMDSSHVLDENDNSYIKFTDSDFSCVKMYPGDLLVEFGGGWNYDIYPIESEGYTMPQEFTVDADNGCIEFRRKNLSEKMEENNMPLNKIYEINGETASSIQDYVEVNGDYYLSYTEPTGIFYKYYSDYESKEGSATVSVKYYLLGQKYYAEAQTAPEGYGYYKIPEGTPAGLYCVRTSGYSFIIDIIE